ncbi:MAG TPA: hypothetical protein VGD98_18400 [Ktedonobacteraceae bacterium]
MTETLVPSPGLRTSAYSAVPPVVETGGRWPVGLGLCTLAFLFCILLTVTPLTRMPDPLFHLHIAWGSLLGVASQWLPANLGPTYQKSSASIEFFCLISLAFLCYCLSAFLVRRRVGERQLLTVRVCIWLGVTLAGAMYVITPGLLSHDTLVYAGYSRLLAVYHVNPYFVVFANFPHDPLVPFDQWSQVNAVYGPIWLLVCALPGFLLKPTLVSYVVAFRLIALLVHLLNTWLVARVLYERGCSRGTRTLGMLLYAWHPLILLESALNGHNDGFMLTFVLLGALLVTRAERRGELARARGYLPPLGALMLAVLVKFAILPVVAVYLLFLLFRALRPTLEGSSTGQMSRSNWRVAAWVLGCSCLVALLIALLGYAPFWAGRSLGAIIGSFTNNPASQYGENSLLRAVVNWLHLYPQQQANPVWLFLSWRRVWDIINYLAIILYLVLAAGQFKKSQSVSALLAIMLAMMCLVLLITPWFFTWYVTWIVGLAVVCLPARRNRALWSCFFLALTFSYSALSLYLFNQNLLGPNGYLTIFSDLVPPLGAFLLCWYTYGRSRRSLATGVSQEPVLAPPP